MRLLGIVLILISTGLFLVNAASFNANVSPSSIEAGQSEIFNFTVTNTNTLNITKVEIKIPTYIDYVGSQGNSKGATFSYESSTKTLIWQLNNLVQPGETVYFWFEGRALAYSGNQDFLLITTDENSTTSNTTLTVSITDTTPPTWSNVISYPPSPKKYDENPVYFNVTWNDNVNVSEVVFETNVTGSVQNQTANKNNNVYYIQISNLTPGTYYWISYARDNNGNWNKTDKIIYVVERGDNIVKIYVNDKPVSQKIKVSNESKINITGFGKGNVFIYLNGVQVASGTDKATYNDYLNVNNYTVKVNASGNSLYVSNSSGKTITLQVSYPAPYVVSVNTNIPSYYENRSSVFEVLWGDYYDPDVFSISYIEANFSGSAKNYTMVKDGNKSVYSIVLDAGSYYWRAYAKNKFGEWGKTQKYYFTIKKASPNLAISVFPKSTVYEGTQLTVVCLGEGNLILKLYRNGTLVDNPDYANLSYGVYLYTCETSGNNNYNSENVSRIVRVLRYTAKLDIIKYPEKLTAIKNETLSFEIEVQNSGEKPQIVSVVLEGIDDYEISRKSVRLEYKDKATFEVEIDTTSLNVGKYDLTIKAVGNESGDSVNVILVVLLPEYQLRVYNQSLMNFSKTLEILEDKAKEFDNENLTLLINQTKNLIELSNSYINSEKHDKLIELVNKIKSNMEKINNLIDEMEKAKQAERFRRIITYVAIIVVAIVTMFFIYLLWPTP